MPVINDDLTVDDFIMAARNEFAQWFDVHSLADTKRDDRLMGIRYFDMTLNDGRVYRVRVSDITPEKVEA